MGNVTVYVSESEFSYFLKGQSFEGKTSRQYETDIQIQVPPSAIKGVEKFYREYLTVFVYSRDQW